MILTLLRGHVLPPWPDGFAILVYSYTVVVTDHLVVVVQYIHSEEQGGGCSHRSVIRLQLMHPLKNKMEEESERRGGARDISGDGLLRHVCSRMFPDIPELKIAH
jgi:hypothetical protein